MMVKKINIYKHAFYIYTNIYIYITYIYMYIYIYTYITLNLKPEDCEMCMY